jgi:hypothetical protein
VDIREFEFLNTLVKERRAELQHVLEVEALLHDPSVVVEDHRKLMLTLTVAAVLLVVIVASSAHLFI